MASRTVKPTGDPDGDTANVQLALDALRSPIARFDAGRLLLGDGTYLINKPLIAGASDSLPVSLKADHYAVLKGAGEMTDQPLLTCKGGGRSRCGILSGLIINPMRKSRGVVFDGTLHTELMCDCIVLFARQVAIEAKNCWGSAIRNSEIASSVGVGLLAHNFNTIRIDQMRVLTYGCHHRTWDNAKNWELWRHEIEYGRESAMVTFGEDYVDDWPAEVAGEDRACMILHGGNQIIDGLNFENARPCEYPLINWRTATSSLRGMRTEGTSTRHAKVVMTKSHAASIGFVEGGCPDHADGHCTSFVALRGACSDITIHDSIMQGLGTGVICGGERLNGSAVSRVRTIDNTVPGIVPL